MKVLLDENLPHPLRLHLPGHEVVTVAYAGWAGTQNGELLNLAESAGFDVLLTGDKNLSYQQDLRSRRIAIVVLTDQRWPIVRQHLHEIRSAVEQAKVGSFAIVAC